MISDEQRMTKVALILGFIALIVFVILLSLAANAQTKPKHSWPIRLVTSVAKQYVTTAHDCTHRWDFALECVAVLGSGAFDFKTTSDAIHVGLQEGNPFVYGIIGKRPGAAKLIAYDAVNSSIELVGLNYLYHTRDVDPKGPLDIGLAGLYAGVHIWAGIHNTHLVNECRQAGIVCH